MTALLFGSLSTLADTSELQRRAFNEAFAQHGLDWVWDREQYRDMLADSGGAARVAAYAKERGESVDADAVHATKSAIFQQSLAGEATPRPGVVDTIARAKATGTRLGFVTTTSAENLSALFAALAPAVRPEDFDLVVSSADVSSPKPDPAVYTYALQTLDESAGAAVAIEDNIGGVRSALAAGLRCVAFPNENTAARPFDVDGSVEQVSELDFDQLLGAASPA